jgi:hypothetical protein
MEVKAKVSRQLLSYTYENKRDFSKDLMIIYEY